MGSDVQILAVGGGSVLNIESDGYQIESRYCCDCKRFKDMGMMQIPICTKKLMGVTRTMKVTFKATEGTCFESKTHNVTVTVLHNE